MQTPHCARRFILALSFLSLGMLAPSVAGAGEAEQIRTDVADALTYAFAGKGGEAILTYAGIDVTGAAAPYGVTVRQVKFAPQWETEGVILGDVGFSLAPAGAGLYAVSNLHLPSTIGNVFSEGMDQKLYIGEARLDGIWSQPLRAFLSFDAAFDDVAMEGGGGEWVSVASLALQGARTEVSPTETSPTEISQGRWDQRNALTIVGLRFEGRNTRFGIGRIEACLQLPRADLQALRTLWRMLTRDPEPVSAAPAASVSAPEPSMATDIASACAEPGPKAATPSDAGLSDQSAATQVEEVAAPVPERFPLPDLLAGFHGAPTILADLRSRIEVRDFYLYQDGMTWRLDREGLRLDLLGADGMTASLGLSLQLDNLRGIPTPDFMVHTEDLQQQRVIAGLVPRDIAIELQLDALPFTALWKALIDSQEPARDLQSEDEALSVLAGAAYALVTQAGSGLHLTGWRIASRIAEIAIDGNLRADAAMPMGANGSLDVTITGLDDVIRLLRDNIAEPGDVLPLGLLAAFGARETDPAGATVDRYAFSIGGDGKLLLNGKDFLPLIELMQR